MEPGKWAYTRRFSTSLGISLAIHLLFILLLPLGLMPPVTIYPVEYGDVTDAILASGPAPSSVSAARPPAAPATAPKAPATTTVIDKEAQVQSAAREAPVQPAQKEAPPKKPLSAEKPMASAATEKPAPARPVKPGSEPLPEKESKAPDVKVAGPAGKPDILTSPGGEESIEAPSPKEGPPQAEVGPPSEAPGSAHGATTPAPGAHEAATPAPGTQETKEAPGGTQLRPEDFGRGESLVTSAVRPVYPKNAQNEGVEGTVEAVATVSPEGRLLEVNITRSSGDPRLDAIVVRTTERAWTFKALGVEYNVRITVVFSGEKVSVDFGGVTFAQ